MGSSVAAEDIVPWLRAGQEDGVSRCFRAELSRWPEENRENVGGWALVWPQRGLFQDKTTGMMIQTKETRDYHGACWTVVEGVQSSRRTLMIVF